MVDSPTTLEGGGFMVRRPFPQASISFFDPFLLLDEMGPSETPPGGHNELSGVVRDASYLGVSTQYQIEARGGARLTVYEQNVERATRAELWAPGEAVRLTWSPDHSFVVRETGGADPAPGLTESAAPA